MIPHLASQINLNPSYRILFLTKFCINLVFHQNNRMKLPVIKEILIKFLDYDDGEEEEEGEVVV